MNLPVFIARRYLLSKKKTNFVNVLSLISFLGISLGTAALIAVLSVFNGLRGLVGTMYAGFDPDLKLGAQKGKYLLIDEEHLARISELKGISAYTLCLEENALIKYNDRQEIARLKGIQSSFAEVSNMQDHLYYAEDMDSSGFIPGALLGNSLAYRLGISLNNPFDQLELYVPKKSKVNLLRPDKAFEKTRISPVAVFDVQPQINSEYVLVPLETMKELLPSDNLYSSLELRLDGSEPEESIRDDLNALFNDANVRIQNRYEQQETIFKIFRLEKWSAYAILSLIVFIAALNLIASLSMLALDKRIDLGVLRAMGAYKKDIKRTFFAMGMLLTLVGSLLGVGLGTGVCFLQERFGLLKIQGEGAFVVDAYPVVINASDIIIVFLTIVAMGSLCSLYPSWRASKDSTVSTSLLSSKN